MNELILSCAEWIIVWHEFLISSNDAKYANYIKNISDTNRIVIVLLTYYQMQWDLLHDDDHVAIICPTCSLSWKHCKSCLPYSFRKPKYIDNALNAIGYDLYIIIRHLFKTIL